MLNSGFSLEDYSLIQEFAMRNIVRDKAECSVALDAAWKRFSSTAKGMPKKEFKRGLILLLGLAGISFHERLHQREAGREQWLWNLFKGCSLLRT